MFIAAAILMAVGSLSTANLTSSTFSGLASILETEHSIHTQENQGFDHHFLGNLEQEKELELIAEEVEEEDWRQSYKLARKDHYSFDYSNSSEEVFEVHNAPVSASRAIQHSNALASSSPHIYLLHSVFII
ncbi:hypothetical protein [Nonlabens agnitus]|uniref:Uncharacterized protein n=1 Tax=Nonlabens agnitus TaxID=870484 RepID=A0A2S9WT86_9FLAO|nr:hypothetical protein [Nonlabens agnitus]PRP66688.1 hypothetical protein BST86_06025 [Nonlabens agnitus]